MYFNPLLPGGSDNELWKKYELNFSEWLIVKKAIHEWNNAHQKPKAFAESGFDFKTDCSVDTVNLSGREYAGCKAGKRELIITPDGFIAACPLLSTKREFHSMNIREYSLEDIWNRDEWICKLRQVDETTIKGKCRDCKNLSICRGGCHILAYLEYGDINFPDPRCPYRIFV